MRLHDMEHIIKHLRQAGGRLIECFARLIIHGAVELHSNALCVRSHFQ